MTMNKNIKNIIFDLGAVVIDIDVNLTYQAFATLWKISPKDAQILLYQNDAWNKHESGEISDNQWRIYLQSLSKTPISVAQIDSAFNALLLDVPKIRINKILELSQKYNIFVLSNTNAIHAKCFNNLLFLSTGIANLDQIFNTVYYSHLLGLRKPNIEIYNQVLSNSNINATETLFLDDNLDNILAAQSIGIQAQQVVAPLTMLDYLKKY